MRSAVAFLDLRMAHGAAAAEGAEPQQPQPPGARAARGAGAGRAAGRARAGEHRGCGADELADGGERALRAHLGVGLGGHRTDGGAGVAGAERGLVALAHPEDVGALAAGLLGEGVEGGVGAEAARLGPRHHGHVVGVAGAADLRLDLVGLGRGQVVLRPGGDVDGLAGLEGRRGVDDAGGGRRRPGRHRPDDGAREGEGGDGGGTAEKAHGTHPHTSADVRRPSPVSGRRGPSLQA